MDDGRRPYDDSGSAGSRLSPDVDYALVSFGGAQGASPESALIADVNGNLFGTTVYGGPYAGYGTVFEIVKTATG